MKHNSLALIIFGALLTLGFGLTALVFVPLTDSSLQEPTAVARAYGDLEELGRAVYQREGCAYCHSQQVRSVPADRPFGTWVAEPGDYVHDVPHPLGRRRIGPDLRFVGDREASPEWYVGVLTGAHRTSPHSRMPSYAHLSERELQALAAYLASGTGGYEDMDFAVADAAPTGLFPPVAPAYADLINPVARTADILASGQQRYDAYCASCHGTAGDGRGPAAMALNPPPANFTDAKYLEASDAYLYWRIAEGVPGTMMPAWGSAFSEEEMWELVHYLREFHGG